MQQMISGNGRFLPLSFLLSLVILFSSLAIAHGSPLNIHTGGLPQNYPESRVEVDSNRYPWNTIGRINLSGQGYCTGTLVGEDLVLTAAHCLWNRDTARFWPARYIHFVPGYHRDIYPAHSRAKRLFIAQDFPRPLEVSSTALENDWALIELEKPLGRQIGYIPWRLFSSQNWRKLSQKVDNQSLLAGYRADRPHVLAVDKNCAPHGFVNDGKLFLHGGATLFGDSGGPFLLQQNGQYSVIGVASAKQKKDGQEQGIVVPTSRFAGDLKKWGAVEAVTQ